MNEWAARLLSVFPPERNRAELDEFIVQVTNDQAEHMLIQKEFDQDLECRPTFEQVSQERIVEEANKNITVLKALEMIVNERMLGFDAFHNNVTKTRSCFDSFENSEGTMKIALDSLFVFTEQEMLQSRQHLFLGDLRRSLMEMKADAQKRINDYLKEINAAEKEVTAAEKKLSKSKEQLERTLDYKQKMESFELDSIIRGVKKATSGGSGVEESSSISSARTVNEHRYSDRMNFAPSGINSSAGGSTTNTSSSGNTGGVSGSSSASGDEAIIRCEKEIHDDIRNLLRVIEHRDQVLSASRRAFQKLDKECRQAAFYTLRKIAEKEKEHAELHRVVLAKLETSVNAIDIDDDMYQFISSRRSADGAMQCSSQALRLLGDLSTPGALAYGQRTPSRLSSGNNSRHTSRSNSFTNSPVGMVENANNSSGQGASHSGARSGSTVQHDYADLKDALSASSGDSTDQVHPTDNTHPTSPPPPTGGVSAALAHLEAPSPASKGKEKVKRRSTRASISHFFRKGGGSDKTKGSDSSGAKSVVSGAAPGASSTVVGDSSTLVDTIMERFPAVQYNQQPVSQADFTGHLTKVFFSGDSNRIMNISAFDETLIPADVDSDDQSNDDGFLTCSSRGSKASFDSHHECVPRRSTDEDQEHADGKLSRHEKNMDAAAIRTKVAPITATLSDSGEERNRHAVVKKAEVMQGKKPIQSAHQWIKSNPNSPLVNSIEWMSRAVRTQSGRDAFIAELNQFRSKKVDLGTGFDALGGILWTTLNFCHAENDVHNAKVIMMLSQTFYKKIDRRSFDGDATTGRDSSVDYGEDEHDDNDDEDAGRRGIHYRQFIKERLMNHPIWQEPHYWEQALWQCAVEQLQMMPTEKAWHEMDRDSRHHAVRRVHDVIFSQVMAITHSMMELGCSLGQCREFLYRMCVIHQLGEAQRQQLLAHVARKN